jgi:hypothetical protein
MRARGAALVLLLAALAVGGCGSSESDLEKSLRKSIDEQTTAADVQFVACPKNVTTGQTFKCKAVIPVDVTQVDDNGNLRWQITNLSGRPGGATGATGPSRGTTGLPGPGAVTGTTGPAFPLGTTGTTSPAAGGKFKTFTNRAQGYKIDYPASFKRRGTGKDVNFGGAGGAFIHVYVGRWTKPRASDIKRELRTNKQIASFGSVTPQQVGGVSGFFVQITWRKPPLKVKRYIAGRGGKRVNLDVSAPPKTAAGATFQSQAARIADSFRLL